MKNLIKQIKKFFTPTTWFRVYSTKCSMYKSSIFYGSQKVHGVAVFLVNVEETKVKAYITDGDVKQYLNPFILYVALNKPMELNDYFDLIVDS